MRYGINDAISVNLIMLKKIKMNIYECMHAEALFAYVIAAKCFAKNRRLINIENVENFESLKSFQMPRI